MLLNRLIEQYQAIQRAILHKKAILRPLKHNNNFRSAIFYPLLLTIPIVLCSCKTLTETQRNTAFAPDIGVCNSLTNAQAIKDNQFDYIETSVGRFLVPSKSDEKFEKNLQKLQTSGLNVYACNGFIPGSLKSVGPNPQHQKILEYAETAFIRAQKSKIKIIVFGSSSSRRVPENFDKKQAKHQFVDLLKKMGPIAEKYNITVTVEPLNTRECNLINSLAQGAEIVRLTDHPNIQLLADIYHMLKENEHPEEILKVAPLLKHCHIAEKTDRYFPGKNRHNFTPYLSALKQINYPGAISIEARWDNYNEDLKIANRYLKNQIDSVNTIP